MSSPNQPTVRAVTTPRRSANARAILADTRLPGPPFRRETLEIPQRAKQQHGDHDGRQSKHESTPAPEEEHHRRGRDGAERDTQVPADREERHAARLTVAADVRSKLGSLGVICRRPEPRDDDEQRTPSGTRRPRPARHARPGQKAPVGSSHTAPRRSDQWPKSGCTSEDAAAEAKTSRQPEGSSGRSARRETGGAPAGRRSRSRSRGARRRGPRSPFCPTSRRAG